MKKYWIIDWYWLIYWYVILQIREAHNKGEGLGCRWGVGEGKLVVGVVGVVVGVGKFKQNLITRFKMYQQSVIWTFKRKLL